VSRDAKGCGFLEVGVSQDGKDVVLNHPDLLVDDQGVGHIVFSPAEARGLALTLLKKAGSCNRERIDLANEQTLCQDMRRSAPSHVYDNDEQIVLSLKAMLDLNMGISSIDAQYLMLIAMRARAGISMLQQKLILALLLDALPTRRCDDCNGDGKSRKYSTLDCEQCMGAKVRFMVF
jgi:hypothetical protein